MCELYHQRGPHHEHKDLRSHLEIVIILHDGSRSEMA